LAEGALGDGTVLILGGTGTLGQLLAEHLARGGTRRLVLVSRRGAEAPGALELRDRLAELGAEVVLEACDAADADALAEVLFRIDARHPLTGVVHAAGIIQDALVTDLDDERLEAVLRAKIAPAVNLDRFTADLPVTTVYFSSVAGILGGAGQANYAAANTMLDALAAHLNQRESHTISIAWSWWRPVSELSAGADQSRLARLGGRALAEADGLALFDQALAIDQPLVIGAAIDWWALRDAVGLSPLWSALVTPTETPENLAALNPEQVLDLVLRNTAALAPNQVPDAETAFAELGLGSLGVIELRNRLAQATGLRLPATLAYDYPSPQALADHLVKLLAPVQPITEVNQVLAALRSYATGVDGEQARALRAELTELLRGLPGEPHSAPINSLADLLDEIDGSLR
jgi:candicidin polyketide synthase FscB